MIAAAPAEARALQLPGLTLRFRSDQVNLIVTFLSDTVEELDGDLARLDVRGDDRRILELRRSAVAEVLDQLSTNWRTARADWELEVASVEVRST